MLPNATLPPPSPLVYPESDGKPMAENTKQLRWIVVLYGNLAALYRGRDDVFVAADLLWYPIEGQLDVRTAPDVLVVFGRPKGDRGSYMQWEENNIPLTVVFEILSPGNTATEMDDKFDFYEEHGVEEYYVYNPDNNRLRAFLRHGHVLLRVRPVQDHVSPRLGIRFNLTETGMNVFWPDGRRFLTFEELEAAREQAEQRAAQAEQDASQSRERASHAELRAARLAELGRKARRGLATVEELQELDRLEEPSGPASP
jgi:Uma2 family endonuclease